MMTNEEREKEIRKQPIPSKEECLAFYKELTKLADIRFVPYYKMAIKALEQQPCEDCISRKEAINVVHKYFVDYLKLNDDICLDGIRSMPSVTPSRSKGKWIHWTDDYKDYVTCSRCEYGEEGEVLLSDKTPFCPICGADMRESEDKE